MPALASLSQADLDALAAEQAAQDAVATPPPGPPPQPTYVPTDLGYTAAAPAPAAPPPQPTYVPTDPGYDLTYPGPPAPDPALGTYYGQYQPEESSSQYLYNPLPASPSMAGPAAEPATRPQFGTAAPTGNDIVTTSYPATGTTEVMTGYGATQHYPIAVEQTYRTIPPEGSTYPARETAYGAPPRDWRYLQSLYARGHHPDIQPRIAGEGPLGGTQYLLPNTRLVDAATWDRVKMPFYMGEGNMGVHDPLAPFQDRPIVGVGRYGYARGERQPPGQETYWQDRAPAPRVVAPGPGSPGGSLGETAMTLSEVLAEMDARRRDRPLRGLFGG